MTVIRLQIGHLRRRRQIHLYLPVSPIAVFTLRRIAQHVLIAQLIADAGADGAQIIELAHRVLAPAGLLSQIIQELQTDNCSSRVSLRESSRLKIPMAYTCTSDSSMALLTSEAV